MRRIYLGGMIVYMLFQLVTGHLALAEPFVEQSSGAKAGLVMLSGIATAPYAVVKLAVATVGSVLGGAINLLSLGYASDTAGRIALGAADGDWYVHPDVFTGERPLHFIGAEAESELPPLPTVRQMGEK